MSARVDLERPLGAVAVFSRGIARQPHLAEFLRAERLVVSPARAEGLDAVVGWGHKPTAEEARAFAASHGLPYLRLEDGFLRSVKPGSREPVLSLVLDDRGIYYDAREPSRLEALLEGELGEDPALLERARHCRERLVSAGLSKYNHSPVDAPRWLESLENELVLVADQTFGDASVELGGGSEQIFQRMLDAALAEHPKATILVKTHPEVIAGRKRGYLTQPLLTSGRVRLVGELLPPAALFARVTHVYVCTSQLGFDALLYGRPVTCFGAPFYAGWGLTDDRQAIARRTRRRSLDELVAASLLVYPRYVHPVTGRRCQAEDAIEHLALQREAFARNRVKTYCFGFTWWKRAFVRRYLESPGQEVVFARSARQALDRGMTPSSRLVAWGNRCPPDVAGWAERQGASVTRMEDGFLRSVRLGSDLSAPHSLVLDASGIYYDPRRPSDLELLLRDAVFSPEELERARALRDELVASGLSKYNPAPSAELRIHPRPGQRVILVPGQVEDDASIVLGTSGVRTNAALLDAARASNPDAYLVYKPHPDVVAKNRRGRVVEAGVAADHVVIGASIADCLEAAHEVHTMTSLVGFEALLRRRKVVTYGTPFYAGWGLTEDRAPITRRTRKLALDELVAGVLLRYPLYYSFRARAFTTAEYAAAELLAARTKRGSMPPLGRFWPVRQVRRLALLARELAHAT